MRLLHAGNASSLSTRPHANSMGLFACNFFIYSPFIVNCPNSLLCLSLSNQVVSLFSRPAQIVIRLKHWYTAGNEHGHYIIRHSRPVAVALAIMPFLPCQLAKVGLFGRKFLRHTDNIVESAYGLGEGNCVNNSSFKHYKLTGLCPRWPWPKRLGYHGARCKMICAY